MSSSQWVRIDTGYYRNPKVRRVGHPARELHLASVLYLGEHRIDTGLLPPEALPLLAVDVGIRRLDDAVAALVKHGLWHPDLGGGFVVHDYDETNGEASEAWLDRQRRRRERDRSRRRRDEAEEET